MILSHGIVDIRGLVYGGMLPLLYLVLSALYFKRVYRQAVRTCLIARFSAESVG